MKRSVPVLSFAGFGVLLVAAMIALGALADATASPNVPAAISYQALLTDSLGMPVSGAFTIHFAIYDDPTGPTACWSETQTVDVTSGVLNVYLGDYTALPESLFDGTTLYLGVRVQSDIEMTPRMRITSVPYAFTAHQASTLMVNDWYRDADTDTYGDPNNSVAAAGQPDGYVADNTDCDDTNPDINPGEEEICNYIDDDCDEEIDEGVVPTWYRDWDEDEWGDPSDTIDDCYQPSGYTANCCDCDDLDPAIHPGAEEICGDDVDQDCDGVDSCYEDLDNDEYGTDTVVDGQSLSCTDSYGAAPVPGDCNDNDPNINPGADEICDDEIDNDCDDLTDYDDPDCPPPGAHVDEGSGQPDTRSEP